MTDQAQESEAERDQFAHDAEYQRTEADALTQQEQALA